MSDRAKKVAPLFLFFSALLWSFGGVFTKTTAWNGVCLAALRGTIAFCVSAMLLRGRRIRLNRQKVLTAICYFTQGLLFMCANKYTTAANATVLQNTSPLYIILFNAVLAKKSPTRRECITCLFLFGGVGLAFAGNISGGGVTGNILALVSALFYAGVFFLSKEKGSDALESLFLGNALYLLLLPVMAMDATVRSTTPTEWAFLLVVATLNGIVAWLCFARGIRHTSALQANFITMAEPVMAPLWTYIFLKESLTPLSLAGCAVVIVTLLVYNVSAVRQAAPN